MEDLKKQFEKLVQDCENPHCPKCNSDDVSHLHHCGDFRAPECDYWFCNDCGHQWGYE